MKKYITRIFLLAILIIGIGTIKSQARIYTSDPTVDSGGTVTVTVSSQENVGAYYVYISNNTGVTFKGVSAPSGVTTEKRGANGITGITTTGTNTLAYYTFTVPTVTTETTYKVTFSSGDMSDTNLNTIANSTATATITVKAPVQQPSPSPSAPPTVAPSPAAPTFSNVNETVYATTEVNIRSSYSTSSSKVGSLQKGDSVTRTGIGSNGWSKVTYNGKTAYIMTSYLTTTKPATPTSEPSAQPSTAPEEKKSNDATLKSLSITGVQLTPEFNPSITSYVASINSDVTDVEVIAEVNNEKAKYEIVGNENLQDGENTIIITVTAEDGTVTNYEIKLTKGTQEIPLNAFVIMGIKDNGEKIEIKLGEPTILENIIEYNIKLEEWLKSIEILDALNNSNIVYEGIGTFDLVVGKNKYTVILKIQQEGAEEKTIEYRITINNPEKVVEITKGENNKVNYKIIASIAAITLVAILVITFLIIHYKKQNKLEYAKPDYSFLGEDEETQDKEKKREENNNNNEPKRKGGKHF